ncbi:major facilitator superfamily domain-containing protein [Syncephalis pseudoplumigaleata]|uniref:Major facilitator superfamily domain-containing protein n=1 Tax=Syncephalis pseudoplumigaleata TaxID=1712513 RepID=A0A4V1J206_9FUNG|nr:major facilitator superfamily domain-containing protein [Syncephalis pseudoplumigaleata]|eukprot:RKP26889.1 major facilitator superfamily domain-containing protein [Syncephalis pseudoplumigaleata]
MLGTVKPALAVSIPSPATTDYSQPVTPLHASFVHDQPLPVHILSTRKKHWILFLAGMAALFGPLSSTIYVPAQLDIATNLGTTLGMVNLTISLFILFYGIAPMVWAPLSERLGRRPIYIASLVMYVVTSIGCALSNRIGILLPMRILQACSSSSASAVGAGSVSDIFPIHERGRKMGYFLLGPLIGPIIGPMVGGALNQYCGWHSIFWFLAGLGGAILLLNIFTMPETLYPEARQKTGRFNPIKPLVYFRFPAVTLIMLYPGLAFGFMYLLITILPRTFINQYAFSTSQVGLSYIASGLGNVLGTVISGRYLDYLIARAKAQSKKPAAEVRLIALWPSAVLTPLGFLMYGWFIERNFHWSLPLFGSFIMSIGLMVSSTVVSVYLVDAFTAHSASVVSLANFVRAAIAAITPLFAVQMVDGLGNGWTFTIIALIFLVSSVIPILVYIYGGRWRPTNKE